LLLETERNFPLSFYSAPFVRRVIATLLILILATLPLWNSPIIAAAPGDFDTTFDTDGKTTTDFSGIDDIAYALAIQTNGKIILAGKTLNSTDDFGVVRYNTNGSLDTSFDTDGKATTAVGTGFDLANSIVIQTDGKIVVGGFMSTLNGDNFALVRYNTDGSLDTSFDGDGKAITDFSNGDDAILSLALQTDGKIVAAGFASTGLKANVGLARYNTDGSLDTSFDTDGKATLSISSGNDVAGDIVLQTNGQIVVAGVTGNNPVDTDVFIARFNSTGLLDTGYGAGGRTVTDFSSSTDGANALVIQLDGKALVAGYTGSTLNQDFALARYDINGNPDTTFNGTGKLTTVLGGGLDVAEDVFVFGNGVIVTVGRTDNGSHTDFAIVEYLQSGALNTSFGMGGIVKSQIGSFDDRANALAVQSDNLLVVAGGSFNGSAFDFAVARYIQFAPTAAVGKISGHISDQFGNAVVGIKVTISNLNTGDSFETQTNMKGYYVFENLPLGNDYVVQPLSKKYNFSPSSGLLSLSDEKTEFNFVGTPADMIQKIR